MTGPGDAWPDDAGTSPTRSPWAPLRRVGVAGPVMVAAIVLVISAAVGSAPGAHVPSTATRSATAAAVVTPSPGGPASTPGPEAPAPSALAAVALLPVKGRAPKSGYDRELYGQAWKDVDRNGCDTRNDILRRDLTDQLLKPGTNGCVVATGTLLDPYSGTAIAFVRGQGTSSLVQIDHVVALSDSWQKGAQQWDAATREAFANDPLNLLAVDGALNQQKGDGDTATWLPPNKGYRCAYVARQVAVKYAYGLWVTQAEQDAMVRVLSTCPSQPLPTTAPEVPAQSP
ncbi:HNH endonuclease family protein [Cellulomonas sp. ICMP 17802]|uniref:HNH endonuclease family protein n=1 Tax=Cellulomonas sp. ICMP 17802 TaxID=3239199 RepID=UPI00351B9D69